MTYREKLKKELPEYIRPGAIAGIKGCPHDYFNIPDNVKSCGIYQAVNNAVCSACWDREVPEEDAYEKALENMGHTAQESAAHLAKVAGAIKDSGERRQFETGAVRDIQEGKGRCDLMPLEVLYAYSEFCEDASEVVGAIAKFQNTGDTVHLYAAIDEFRKDRYRNDGLTMLLEVAKHFEEGAKKYGENNWQKGLPINCYIDSAIRHYLKWWRGDKDEPHDRAFVWNLMCCIWEVDFSPRAKGENVVEETIADIHDEKYSSDESTTKRSETVHYICDRRACEECTNPDCNHTSDIQHAANFEKIGDAYFEKEKPEESVMDIHVESAWIRLGNCPCGLVEIDGVVYVKTAALVSKTSVIAVVNVANGVMTALHPDIYARPLKAIKSEDYNRAWNQKGDSND